MGRAILETAEESFEVDRGDGMIVEESFGFYHTIIEYLHLAVVHKPSTTELYYARPGETIEIEEIGTLTHQE